MKTAKKTKESDNLARFEQAILAVNKMKGAIAAEEFIINKGYDSLAEVFELKEYFEQRKIEKLFEPIKQDYENLLEFDSDTAKEFLIQHGLIMKGDGKIYIAEAENKPEDHETVTPQKIFDEFFKFCKTPGDYTCEKKNGTAQVNKYFRQVINGERANKGLNDCLNFVSSELNKSYNSAGHFNAWQKYLRHNSYTQYLAK